MSCEKLILILRSGFQKDDWLKEEYDDLIKRLESETQIKTCIYGRDSPISIKERIIKSDINIVLVATGGVESTFVELEPYIARDGKGVSLIADGRNNSLAASLEILTYLTNHNRSGRIVHAPNNAEIIKELLHPTESSVSSQETKKPSDEEKKEKQEETVLKGCKVGCVGRPSDWLIASDVDRTVLSTKYGVEVVDVPMDMLVTRYEAVDAERVKKLTDEYMAFVAFITEPAREDISRSLRIYAALKDICTELGLSAMTIRCFDVINKLGATSCIALSMLNDEGIVAGCEGDMQSMLTMLLVRRLLQMPSFMANPSGLRAGETVLAHCTVPRTMCTSLALRSHFESGMGVAPQGTLPADNHNVYTLVKWGGASLQRCFIAEAEAIPVPPCNHDEHLCRTQITLALDTRHYLLSQPIGNHHMVIAGRHADTIRAFMERNNVSIISY